MSEQPHAVHNRPVERRPLTLNFEKQTELCNLQNLKLAHDNGRQLKLNR